MENLILKYFGSFSLGYGVIAVLLRFLLFFDIGSSSPFYMILYVLYLTALILCLSNGKNEWSANNQTLQTKIGLGIGVILGIYQIIKFLLLLITP